MVALAVFFSLGSLQASASEAKLKPFEVRAFHVEFKPRRFPLSKYCGLCDQLAGKGYNTVIFSFGEGNVSFKIPAPGVIQPDGYTLDDLQALISHARSLQLEPIFQLTMIGKQQGYLGELAKKLPGLIHENNEKQRNVLNPEYVMPDGRDIFQALIFPEIDQFIGLYGKDKPKYLLLGIDETELSDLDYYAKQKGVTAAALFADYINRITEHVLDQGITPIIWGDMFLSHQLAKPGHGVEGFDHDPRMSDTSFSYNAYNPTLSEVNVVTSMNSLRNRDRIIVADWQYGKGDINREYPSVDYFQKMGFKDVWGATWYDLNGIQNFSRYAAQKGCGGMIATTWFCLFKNPDRLLLPPIIDDSILLFKDPGFSPPIEKVPFTLTDKKTLPKGGGQMLFSSSTREVSFRAELPVGIVPLNPILSVWNNTGGQPFERQIPMTYLKKKHRLEAVISLPEESADQLPATFDTQVEFTCKKSGWRVQDTHLSSFGIAEHLPSSTLGAPPDAWFYMDFSGLSNGLCKKQLFPVGGKKGGLLWIEQTGGKAEAGGLDCKNLEAYAYPPQEMWDAIYSQGLRLQLEFRVDAPEQKTDYSSLFSYGTYSSGFRILLDSKNQVILQFAEGAEVGRPIRIRFPVAVSMGQWTSLELSVSPPDQQMQRVVRFRVGDAAQMVVPLVRDLVKSSSPVGLGIEFSSSDPIFPKKKTFSLFPGMIRKVSLEAYQAPIK